MGFSRQEYWSGVPLPSLQTAIVPSNSFSVYLAGCHRIVESDRSEFQPQHCHSWLWVLVKSLTFSGLNFFLCKMRLIMLTSQAFVKGRMKFCQWKHLRWVSYQISMRSCDLIYWVEFYLPSPAGSCLWFFLPVFFPGYPKFVLIRCGKTCRHMGGGGKLKMEGDIYI